MPILMEPGFSIVVLPRQYSDRVSPPGKPFLILGCGDEGGGSRRRFECPLRYHGNAAG